MEPPPKQTRAARRQLVCYDIGVRNEFSAYVVRDGDWFVAFSPEIPEGNGQGRTEVEAIESLGESIALIFDYLREEAAQKAPPGARPGVVVVAR